MNVAGTSNAASAAAAYCLLPTAYCSPFGLAGAPLVGGVGRARGDGRLCPLGRAALVAVRDGAAATDADGVARDDERRRELAPLELVGRRLDAVEDVVDERALVPLGDDLLGRGLALEVEAQDGVEHVVGRQRLVVEL